MNLRYARRSEDTEQIAVIQWANWNSSKWPELEMLHHCPNGGSRNKAEAVKLKQMGVVPGMPDLDLPVEKGAYHGLCIEMKYDRGTLQENQKRKLRLLAEQGRYCAVCYGAEEAVKVLKEYLRLERDETVEKRYYDNGKEKDPEKWELKVETSKATISKLMTAPNLSVFRNGKVTPMPPERGDGRGK